MTVTDHTLVSDRNRIIMSMVSARAWRDPEYRTQLLADPNRVLTEEGMDVPAGVTVRIHLDSATERHLVLPPSPEVDAMTLSDMDMVRLTDEAHPDGSLYLWAVEAEAASTTTTVVTQAEVVSVVVLI
jgi:hypothetical protein